MDLTHSQTLSDLAAACESLQYQPVTHRDMAAVLRRAAEIMDGVLGAIATPPASYMERIATSVERIRGATSRAFQYEEVSDDPVKAMRDVGTGHVEASLHVLPTHGGNAHDEVVVDVITLKVEIPAATLHLHPDEAEKFALQLLRQVRRARSSR